MLREEEDSEYEYSRSQFGSMQVLVCVADRGAQATEVAVVDRGNFGSCGIQEQSPPKAFLTNVSGGESVWAILDSGANTMIMKDPSHIWNSKVGVQIIGTAFGSEEVAGVSGGTRFEIGGKEVHLERGVYSRKELPYTLIGTSIMNMAGLSSVFHQGKVYLMDAKEFSIVDDQVVYEGKLDPQTQLPMIEIKAIAQPQVGSMRRQEVDRAVHVNKAGREQALVLEREANNVPEVACLARTYSPFGNTAQQNGLRYHGKLNHIGTKVIERTLKAAGIKYEKPRGLCEVCGLTKVKSHNHGEGSFAKEIHKPGDCIVCDTVGPFAQSRNGGKWWVLMVDRFSSYRMSFVTATKTQIGDCVMEGLKNFGIRSQRKALRVQMDGDGCYTSGDLKKRIAEFGTLASWSSPYDHQQNGCAEKNVHTQYTDACVAMNVSGAPKTMWPEAVGYADFTRNNVRSMWDGSQWVTPKMLLMDQKTAFPPERMIPFGCKIIVQRRKEQRPGPKSLVQSRGWIGAMVGYGENFGYAGAYRVYRPEGRKIFFVSFNHCVVDEGSFPWKMKEDFVKEKKEDPLDWNPTPEAMMDPGELVRYGFDDDEILEVSERFHQNSPDEGESVLAIEENVPALEEDKLVGVEEIDNVPALEESKHVGDQDYRFGFEDNPMEDNGDSEGEESPSQDFPGRGAFEETVEVKEVGVVPETEPGGWTGRLRTGTRVDYAEQPEKARNPHAQHKVPRPQPVKGYIEGVTEMKWEDDKKKYKIEWDSGEKEWVTEYPLRSYGGNIKKQMNALDQEKEDLGKGDTQAFLWDSSHHPMVLYLSIPEPPNQKPGTKGVDPGIGRITKRPGEPIPQNRNEMQRSPYRKGYFEAECTEMETHKINGTWELVSRSSVPSGTKIMPTRWVYDDKTEPDSNGVLYITRFKARLTAMGNFHY